MQTPVARSERRQLKAKEVKEAETDDGREERRRNTLVEDIVPVRVFEEQVRLDLYGIRLSRSQSPGRIASEELRAASWLVMVRGGG